MAMQKLTEQNARQILSAAGEKPVFLYFYVQMPECEDITKKVEAKLGTLNLVGVDVQSNIGQMLAMQTGLQGVPALMVLLKGQPQEMLQGEEIIAQLDDIASRYQPKQSELDYQQALKARDAGDLTTATTKALAAFSAEHENLDYKLLLADLYIRAKRLEDAHALLDNPGRTEQGLKAYKDLMSALTLAEQAQDSPQLKELEKQHRAHPEDLQVTLSLAAALAEAGRRREALEMLLDEYRRDRKEEVKKTYLDILNTMGGDPLQKRFRNQLYSLLY